MGPMTIRSSGRSASLSWDSLTMVPAEATIRCRHDHIIVEPLEVDHGIPALSALGFVVRENGRPVRGIVRAVGPGHYPRRYDHPDKHRRTRTWRSRSFQPTEVKVGDVVELGAAQGTRGYDFQTLLWGDKVHVICREADVAGVEVQAGDYPVPWEQLVA